MKRTLLIANLLLILVVTAQAQTSNSVIYTGTGTPVSYLRDSYRLPNGQIAYITTSFSNAGSSTSPYFMVGNPCGSTLIPVNTTNFDLSNNFNPCFNYFVEQTPNGQVIVTGAVQTSSGQIALLSYYNPVTNILTPSNQFLITGPNLGIKVNGNGIGLDSLRLCSETNLSYIVNGNTVPPYGVIDVSLNDGGIKVRNDLILFDEAGNATATYDVLLLADGRRMGCGGGVKRGSSTGPSALHGYIENATATAITDLGFPGSGLVPVMRMIEWSDGNVYMGHNFSSPALPISKGIVKWNKATGVFSPTSCPYAITMSDMDSSSNKIVGVGSRKISGITTNAFRYDPATDLTEDLNTAATPFFTNTDPSSTLNSVVGFSCPSGCSQAISITGNMVAGTGGSTASNFTHVVKNCTIGSPLPSKLISFTGTKVGNSNVLYWKTATEVNNKGFEVQRSSDGVNYSAIGFVNSQAQGGNSSAELNYSFTDNTINKQDYHYRLNQIDFDAKSNLSKIIVIKDKISVLTIDKVYPNPVVDFLNLSMSSPTNQSVSIKVTDMTGRQILDQQVSLQKGSNALQVNFSKLTPGFYLMIIGDVPYKIIKQ